MSRLLTVILPVPGLSHTRAVASLRRPVPYQRCTSAMILVLVSVWIRMWRRRLQRQRLGLLGRVRMLGPGVDLELGEHVPAEGVLGEHARHRLLDHALGLTVADVGGGAADHMS